jgi:site-specific DNA-methyltransferase (adenine-specific)
VPKVRQHADNFNYHPTLKPVSLMHHLVKLISFSGQTILDPFMGSGSTGLAAVALERKFVGYEKEADYYEIAEKRFEQSFNNRPFGT